MNPLMCALRRGPYRLLSLAGLSAALALAWAAAGLDAAHAAASSELQQLAPGVYYREGSLEDWGPGNQGRVSNQGVIVGERCVAVVDTSGTPAPRFDTCVCGRTCSTICQLGLAT